MKPGKRAAWLVPLLLLIMAAVACNLSGGDDDEKDKPQPTKVGGTSIPTIVIEAPQTGAQVLRDTDVLIYAVATDQQGVTRIEMKVNGQIVDARPSPTSGGDKEFRALFRWKFATAGDQTVEVIPYRNTVAGTPASVRITVRDRASQITVTPGPTLSFITPTSVVQNRMCRIQVAVGALNVRSGPGLVYQALGQITIGQEYQIIGRQIYPEQWWQIYYNGTFGWVSGYYVNALGDCGAVPIVLPPASPTPRASAVPPTIPPTLTPLPMITTPPPAQNLCRVSVIAANVPIYNNSQVRMTIVTTGQQFYVVARDPSSRWYQLSIAGTTGWIDAASVSLTGNCGTLSILPGPATPPPTTPAPNTAPVLNRIPDQTLSVGETRLVPYAVSDANNDQVTVTATAANTSIISAAVSAPGTITLIGNSTGTTTVNVTADDHRNNGSITTTFQVSVKALNDPVIAPIPDVSMTVGDTRDLAFNATDPDGDKLEITVQSSNGSMVGAEVVSAGAMRLTASGMGTAIITLLAKDPTGRSASQSFNVTVENTPSAPSIEPITNQSMTVGETLNVSFTASDPDGDTLTPSVMSNNGTVVTATVAGNAIALTANGAGSAIVTLTVADNTGRTASASFNVAVASRNAPVIEPISNKTILMGETLDVIFNASDPDGDTLTAAVVSSDPAIVGASLTAERTITLTGANVGTATVTISVNDGREGTASVAFEVAVAQPDSDSDGLPNDTDPCPNDPIQDNVGNPCDHDEDDDGIADDVDGCPTEAGPAENNGCPSSTDSDGDGVNDDVDQCPDVAGTADNNGCPPDTDGDGVADNVDACPDKAGTAEQNGCPDTDSDGVTDDVDACPDKPGTEEHNGCPDSDGDGVFDNTDECPDVAGSVDNNGCPPDRDGDGVADDQDACPEAAGPAEQKGCPDTDGDGVTDDVDQCPDKPGTEEHNGCPDSDGDSVFDNTDECPDVAGSVDINGCPPDRDGDGVADDQDACPEAAGPVEQKGCPDTDGDGVTDDVDQCPDKPGTEEHNGCPDSDSDGVFDDTDECPDVAGTIDNNGCPPDRDGDGVADDQDVCPEAAGPAEQKGCPDTDGDGVADNVDECPNEAGTAENNGCPPDSDSDSIPNDQDACPDQAGTEATNGCPDADTDGVADGEDACPAQAGTAENNGCPADTDADGVADDQDQCPAEAGTTATNGCPDADTDGVADNQDACPALAGTAENNGCPADTDADGVADSEDACPNEAGTAATNGCPDADTDGVADNQDACPAQAGTAENNGCPADTDADGVADSEDACPNEAGTAATNGCPDGDADGIADNQDACPTQAGTAENNGCPADTDADGVADSEDACPNEAGTAATNGCPDADTDGVADNQDACPTQAGTAENNGCPADTDADGVADDQDQCPNEAGTAATNGCPDSDTDGVADNQDACPAQAGTAENNGCPADTDADGVPDDQDACPNEVGPADSGGCPAADSDADGIADNQDACPNEAGPADNNGCPTGNGGGDTGEILNVEDYPNLTPIEGDVQTMIQAVYQQGKNVGANPGVFSAVGDTPPEDFLFDLAVGTGDFGDLADASDLAAVVFYFAVAPLQNGNSFQAGGTLASGTDWAVNDLLNSNNSDPAICQPGETPIDCEMRVNTPAVVLVFVGRNDVFAGTPVDEFETDLNTVVNKIIDGGGIPVLTTIPGDVNSYPALLEYNTVIIRISDDNELPLVNLARVMNNFPGTVNSDLTLSDSGNGALYSQQIVQTYGRSTRNVLALRMLQQMKLMVPIP